MITVMWGHFIKSPFGGDRSDREISPAAYQLHAISKAIQILMLEARVRISEIENLYSINATVHQMGNKTPHIYLNELIKNEVYGLRDEINNSQSCAQQ